MARGLAVRLTWGDQPLAEHFFAPGARQSLTVGTAKGVTFPMGNDKLGGPKFEAVTTDRDGFAVRFHPEMHGELHRADGTVIPLEQAIRAGVAWDDGDGHALSLRNGDFAWVDLGGVVLEASLRPVPKRVTVPLSESLDFTALNILLATFFIAGLLVVTACNHEAAGEAYSDELRAANTVLAKVILTAAKPSNNPLLDRVRREKERSADRAARSRGREGAVGRQTAPDRPSRFASGHPVRDARGLVQSLFGAGNLVNVLGPAGLDRELRAAMGQMVGAVAADSRGFGGLGLRGEGDGGGGSGEQVRIGALSVRGRSSGTDPFGGVATLPSNKERPLPDRFPTGTRIEGALDRELVRQVIHRNRNQIRYCYERELTRSPQLAGKVSVRFVISPDGSVSSAQVFDSTANHPVLESCVVQRVRTWHFPKPKGGGQVWVSYPFVFRASGE